MSKILEGVSRKGVHGRPWKQFFKDLKNEIADDGVVVGSAALGFYLMLAIFPAMLFLLSLLPYLPIPNLEGSILGLLNQALPGESAQAFTSTVQEVASQRKGGLLTLGALLTLWAASSGMYAVMQQLNITYDVKEGRPFWKSRGIAILLTVGFGLLLTSAFGLIVVGDLIQSWLSQNVGGGAALLTAFAVVRWVVVAGAILLAFAITYYFGPHLEQRFRLITPGSVVGVVLLIAASLGFKVYVDGFGSYGATYGSIGAMIVLMLWLQIVGLVILFGSEVNALIEHYEDPAGQALDMRKAA